jgi:hypothetical protein
MAIPILSKLFHREAPIEVFERLCHKEVCGLKPMTEREQKQLHELKGQHGLYPYVDRHGHTFYDNEGRVRQIEAARLDICYRHIHDEALPGDELRLQRLSEEMSGRRMFRNSLYQRRRLAARGDYRFTP